MRSLAAPIVVLALAPLALADGNPIQPGDLANEVCTLGFVLDGVGPRAGDVFLLSAAHCFLDGDVISTDGHPDFGTVVHRDAEWGSGGLDFVLIEVGSASVGNVAAEVLGHGGSPTGVLSEGQGTVGDVLLHSGWGYGLDGSSALRENRPGVLLDQSASAFRSAAAVWFGDSGGPVLHASSGRALGLVSHLWIGSEGAFDQGPTIEAILDRLDEVGYPASLRTA